MPPSGVVEVNLALAQLSEDLIGHICAIFYLLALVAYAGDLISGAAAQRKAQAAAKAAVAEGAAAAGSAKDGGVAVLAAPANVGAVSRQLAKVALVMTLFGFAAHLTAVICRGISVHRVPWGNVYEFSITGTCLIVALFLILLIKNDLRYLGIFVIGPVYLLMMAAQVGWYTEASALVPALQGTYWLVVHVVVAIIAVALFAVAAIAACLQIVQAKREATAAQGHTPKAQFMNVLPKARAMEALSYKLNAYGFVAWTFTLVAGSIWANEAWGRYWGWDPKEVWTFVIWVVYAAYMHARYTRNWRGNRAAWFSIIGFICVLCNFTLVNLFAKGLHSYSGV